MDKKQIDNLTEEIAPQEFKTNTARYVMFIVFWVIVCLLFVNTSAFGGVIIIAIIATIPSTLKLLYNSMTIKEHGIEYKSGWLNINRV